MGKDWRDLGTREREGEVALSGVLTPRALTGVKTNDFVLREGGRERERENKVRMTVGSRQRASMIEWKEG